MIMWLRTVQSLMNFKSNEDIQAAYVMNTD